MSGYRFLGYVVWRAGKWYLRRRLSSRRAAARADAAALIGVAALALVVRRRTG